jgi:deoxyribose-phosphate aldolase
LEGHPSQTGLGLQVFPILRQHPNYAEHQRKEDTADNAIHHVYQKYHHQEADDQVKVGTVQAFPLGHHHHEESLLAED